MICIYCDEEIQKGEPFYYRRLPNGVIDQTRHGDCWLEDSRATRQQSSAAEALV